MFTYRSACEAIRCGSETQADGHASIEHCAQIGPRRGRLRIRRIGVRWTAGFRAVLRSTLLPLLSSPLLSAPLHSSAQLTSTVLSSAFLASALTIAPVASAQQTPAPTPQEIQQAQARWKEGTVAFDKHDYEVARLAFRQAYAAYPHPAFLQNLGETELRCGRNLEAARHFALYLRQGSALTDGQRQLATTSLKKAAERLGAIVVESNVEGAEVKVDGEVVGKTPLAGSVWYVEPGQHAVIVRKDGYLDSKENVSVPIGDTKTVNLPMKELRVATGPEPPLNNSRAAQSSTQPGSDPKRTKDPKAAHGTPGGDSDAGSASSGSASAAASNPDSTTASTSGSMTASTSGSNTGRTVVLIAEGVLAATGLAVGIGYMAAASSTDNDAQARQARVDIASQVPGAGTCGAPGTPTLAAECSGLSSALSNRDTDQTLSIAGFVGAGVGVAALVTTLLVWHPKSNTGDNTSQAVRHADRGTAPLGAGGHESTQAYAVSPVGVDVDPIRRWVGLRWRF